MFVEFRIVLFFTKLCREKWNMFNPLTPNDHYSGRTAPLTSKRFILYIYSTNISTEYFKHGIYSPFYSLQNAVCFIILTYLVPVLFTFYLQGVLKLKNNSGAKRLTNDKKITGISHEDLRTFMTDLATNVALLVNKAILVQNLLLVYSFLVYLSI